MRRKNKHNLNVKQQSFCEHYIANKKIGVKAAISAGYSERTADVKASQLLSLVKVQDYIEELLEEAKERNKITVDELIQGLADITRFDLAEIFNEDGSLKPIHEIPEAHRKALSSVETYEDFAMLGQGDKVKIGETKKAKAYSKLTATEMLLKLFGAFKEDNDQKKSNVYMFEIPKNGRD